MHFEYFQSLFRRYFSVFIYGLLALCSAVAVADENEAIVTENDNELFAKAVQLSSQQQWAQAEPIYRDLIKRNSNWPEPGNNLAILLVNTERMDEAKQVIEQTVSSTPAYRIAQQNRTLLYNFLATQAYDKALGEKPNNELPELELIKSLYQPVKIIEKEKIIEVEKVVIVKQLEEQSQLSEAAVATSTNDQEQINKLITQQLLGWSRAWSQGEFDSYMLAYSQNFMPSDARKTYAEWKNIRRARLKFTRGVKVEIEQIRVFVGPQGDYALVEFIQNYHSDSYNDKVLKQMYMHNKHNNWLILSERTIKTF
jgi:tetratricopeptide (TPR) repeat protein